MCYAPSAALCWRMMVCGMWVICEQDASGRSVRRRHHGCDRACCDMLSSSSHLARPLSLLSSLANVSHGANSHIFRYRGATRWCEWEGGRQGGKEAGREGERESESPDPPHLQCMGTAAARSVHGVTGDTWRDQLSCKERRPSCMSSAPPDRAPSRTASRPLAPCRSEVTSI